MKLSELIDELDRALEVIGDVDVEVRNEAGEYDIAEVVTRGHDGVKWQVIIDV